MFNCVAIPFATMMARSRNVLSVFLALSLLANAFSAPNGPRWRRDSVNHEVGSTEKSATSDNSISPKSEHGTVSLVATEPHRDDDDDDFSHDPAPPPPAPNGGSNIFSLLRLAGALLPSLSGGSVDKPRQKHNSKLGIQKIIELIKYNQTRRNFIERRKDIHDNEIEIDYPYDLKPPPFQRQETEESDEDSTENTEDDDDSDNGSEQESTENGNENNGNTDSKADSESNETEEETDYDDEPESDGQGGGILGLIAGLSGGDGQSDLGSLLAAVSGIVANLSGDGIDLNALIASGLGLFVGLLSEGEENPGAIIASYLLTSLETITGGGAQNNGAFFGNLVSKLVKGTSAGADPDGSSEENKMPMSDSTGFFISLIMSILGDMSKTSSGGSSS